MADASVLIALDQLGLLELLRSLYTTVALPPAVFREASVARTLPNWLIVEPLSLPLPSSLHAAGLDAGEAEVVALALERGSRLVLLDDLDARLVAEQVGLTVTGTLGILIDAKERQLLNVVSTEMDKLRVFGFFISSELYQRALRLAGEADG